MEKLKMLAELLNDIGVAEIELTINPLEYYELQEQLGDYIQVTEKYKTPVGVDSWLYMGIKFHFKIK